MSEIVSQVYVTHGRTAEGFAVDVTYRIAGSPHVWQYVEARRLSLPESLELIEAAMSAVLPGYEPPSLPGQLPLPI